MRPFMDGGVIDFMDQNPPSVEEFLVPMNPKCDINSIAVAAS